MNMPVFCSQQTYFEKNISTIADPLVIAGLLADSDLSETYVVYENHGEWSIGMGAAITITINALNVRIHTDGRPCTYCKQYTSLSDSIDAALKTISINNWRVYGTANFELSRYKLGLPILSDDEYLLQLIVPTFEVRMKNGSALLRALGEDKLEELTELFNSINRSFDNAEHTPFDSRLAEKKIKVTNIDTHDADFYQRSVSSALDEIQNQQYVKVILSRVIPLAQDVDIISSYISGRRVNTPARSFLLNLHNIQAAGFSPETVVEVTKDGWVSTRPLAGTRLLGSNDDEEKQLREELLRDSKEISEHAVSVQLAFEELCAVCKKETVCVCDFMSISRRNTVQHLASRVRGQLQEGKTTWNAFAALFPAVTATGIPKRESIEAIGRLEPQPRGLYGGCVLIADSDGSLDAALVLRTVFKRNQKAWMHVGAGIVNMSNPERELEETCEKIQSVSECLISF